MKGLECNVLSLEVVTREVRIRIKCKELDLTSGCFFVVFTSQKGQGNVMC